MCRVTYFRTAEPHLLSGSARRVSLPKEHSRRVPPPFVTCRLAVKDGPVVTCSRGATLLSSTQSPA